jgi:hypothetical protein
MATQDELPEPHQTQLRLHQELATANESPLLVVHLHKAKFHQGKVLTEFQGGVQPESFLDSGVYEQSKRMIASRNEATTNISAKDAFQQIASERTWIGALPAQMYRESQEIYLRGYPFLVGFADGTPRVVLNKILVQDSANLDRVYANEWARPWLIAEILDATGFNTRNLIVATMKADQRRYRNPGLDYLRDLARRTVEPFVEYPDEEFVEPKAPVEWVPDWQDGPVRTELLKYETEWSLYERIGHGDSIRDVIEMFRGNRPPKDTPPDRGKTLQQVL